jgi:alkanesulfonate monooxygenase
MLESYTTLSYIAGVTEKIKLGTLVTGAVYRAPGLLAKIVSTLDQLSGGRAFLGIGAAWNEQEAMGLGIPFPPLGERFERLEEALQIVLQMWDENANGPYNGKHYQLAETLNHPQPIQKPHPPILIGGVGEKKTLRLVAQYADACNFFGSMPPEVLQQRLATLKGHCETLGRSYNAIEKSLVANAFMDDTLNTADAIIAYCERMAKLGFEHVHFIIKPDERTLQPLDIFGEKIIPAVADLVVA